MADNNTITQTTGNAVHRRDSKSTSRNDQHNAANAETKKGFWARYTQRLKDTHCTLTPPECR
jgi:hypothetical protein